jgi:HEAT repeat protein
MEIWNYIEILGKSKRTRLFGKEKNQAEKLFALNKLSKIGYPSIIYQLIPFLKDDSEKIRTETVQTIKILFDKLAGKKAYYESLKHCSISKSDIEYYKLKFDKNDFTFLMTICSLNSNGYVREAAVKKLSHTNNEAILPFIIFRLTDWVPNVRQVAEQGLRNFFQPKFLVGLITNLSLFNWLQKVQRTDLSGIYREVIYFLIVKNRNKIIQQFKKITDKERLILAKELSEQIQSKEEINLFINDKHFLIRLLTLNHFDKLTEGQKEKLLNDKSAKVRQSSLYCYKDNDKFQELLISYLADKSGSIRYLSRFYLKESKIDFREFYMKNLNEEKQVIGSLLGLLDIEAKDCYKYIKPYLESEKIRNVKTAFYVLSNLNPHESFNFAKTNLFTNKIGLRNLIIEYFGKNQNKEVLENARIHYQEADEEIKRSILKLYSKIGGYDVFPDLLIGTIDKIESIRNQSNLYVHKWKSEAISMFSKPNEAEKNRAIKVFHFVNEAHIKNEYFNTNLVEGLDFYIK